MLMFAEHFGMRWFFLSAFSIMKTLYEESGYYWEFYGHSMVVSMDVAGNLISH
jgi:hypothetical protein